MAVLSLADMTQLVLEHLAVIASGESATPDDQTLVASSLNALVTGELSQSGTLPDELNTNNYPEWAQNAVRDVVAFRLAPSFGRLDKLAAYAAQASEALAYLRRQLAPVAYESDSDALAHAAARAIGIIKPGEKLPAIAKSQMARYVLELFDWFAQRGTLAFTADDIPLWARPHLRDLLAQRAAPEFGIADPNQIQIISGQASAAWDEFRNRAFVSIENRTSEDQLVSDVLVHLQLLGPHETPNAGQEAIVKRAMAGAFAILRLNKVAVFSESNIPQRAMIAIRDYVAACSASALKIPMDLPTIESLKQLALKELRAQSRIGKGPEPSFGNFF